MISLRTNLMSNTAIRHMNINYDNLSRSMEKLVTGKRINSSRDDAAGLAVVSMLQADIEGIKQGRRNVSDGISMLQTMDGSMGVVDDILIRMKQLAEQASTGSYTSQQRQTMNEELQQLVDEIDRISGSADFNGISILRNSRPLNINLGDGSAIDFNNVNIHSDALGLAALDISGDNGTNAQGALGVITDALESMTSSRATLGAKMNRLEVSEDVLWNKEVNLTEAKSRIEDVDIAAEVTEFVKHQVLTQTSTAMVAQANDMQKLALKLLEN